MPGVLVLFMFSQATEKVVDCSRFPEGGGNAGTQERALSWSQVERVRGKCVVTAIIMVSENGNGEGKGSG